MTSELGIEVDEQRLEKSPEEAWRGVPLYEAEQAGTFRTAVAGSMNDSSYDLPNPQQQFVPNAVRVLPGVSEHQ